MEEEREENNSTSYPLNGETINVLTTNSLFCGIFDTFNEYRKR